MQQMIINIHFLDDKNVGWRKGVQRRAHQSSSSCHYGGHAADCTTLRMLFLNYKNCSAMIVEVPLEDLIIIIN